MKKQPIDFLQEISTICYCANSKVFVRYFDKLSKGNLSEIPDLWSAMFNIDEAPPRIKGQMIGLINFAFGHYELAKGLKEDYERQGYSKRKE